MSGVLKTINVHVFMARYVRTELVHHSAYIGTIVYSSSYIGAMSLSLAVIYCISYGLATSLAYRSREERLGILRAQIVPYFLTTFAASSDGGGPQRVVEYPVIVLYS
jgi:hypothetical protein